MVTYIPANLQALGAVSRYARRTSNSVLTVGRISKA